MIYLAMVVAMAVQDGVEERLKAAGEALEKAQREYRLSLVELGPEAIPTLEKRADQPQVKQAIEEIRRLKEPIEKLIAQLADEKPEVREKATAELMKVGRPARPYLEKARAGGDAEVRKRAEIVLLLIHPSFRDRAHWKTVAALQKRKLEETELLAKRGVATTRDLLRVRGALAKARVRAGETTRDEYLKEAQERCAQEVKLAERERAVGVGSEIDLLKARLQGLYVDRRMGKDVDAEIQKILADSSLHFIRKVIAGLAGEHSIIEEMLEFTLDPDTDLD